VSEGEGADGLVRVRCPNPACGAELAFPPGRLGRNEPCPACGQVITVVPIALQERVRAERRGPPGARQRTMPVAVVLENVRSLWNVGSIFRTADAAGAEEIWLCGITGRPPRDEISKTALGAEDFVPWRAAADAREALEYLKGTGRSVVALERAARSLPLSRAKVRFPCALVLGNEVAGLSDAALDASDLICHLPMHGVKSSLNVAVAAGVALYELRRKAEAEGVAQARG
jgi:tRNA G18 (ribose-2'-O)-methylase SpoU